MNKISALFAGWREQRNDPKRFNQPEKIKDDLAKQHAEEADERQIEELKKELGSKREEPNPDKIVGPSKSEEK